MGVMYSQNLRLASVMSWSLMVGYGRFGGRLQRRLLRACKERVGEGQQLMLEVEVEAESRCRCRCSRWLLGLR